jgi:hypothetical protein
MKFLVKIVVTGFGLAMGGALFKKVAPYLNLDDKANAKPDPDLAASEGATDPGLQHPHHSHLS